MFGRILILQTGFLGDVVLATPLMQAARALWPRAHLAVMVRPTSVPLLEGLPFLDSVLVDTRHDTGRSTAFRETLDRLRAERFDLAFSAARSLQTGLLLWRAGIPRRVGYRSGLNRWLYTDVVRRPKGVHVSRREFALLEAVGGRPEFFAPAVAEADRLPAEVEALLAGSEPLVALAPGSVWPNKRWLPEHFAEVARRLTAEGARVVLTGGPGDREIAAQIVAAVPQAVDLCGRTRLTESAALLRRCALLVSNDSAPVHLAGAVGTPVVQIYGATTPDLGFAPLDPRSKVVEIELDCRPCKKLHAPACPLGHFRCMRDLTPDLVTRAALEILRGGR